MKDFRQVNPISLRHLLNTNHDDAILYIKSLLKTPETDGVNETYWFPTPQNSGKRRGQTTIQASILNKLRRLKELKQLNAQDNKDSRTHILSNFDWADSTLKPEAN